MFYPKSDPAILPRVQRSVACVSIHTPGPVQTLNPPAVASGHPMNANSAGIAKSPRQSFRVVQTLFQQGVSLKQVAFRVILAAVFNSPANQRQRAAEVGVGGFHSSQSLAATSGVETFTS